jgi:hypothetical protein
MNSESNLAHLSVLILAAYSALFPPVLRAAENVLSPEEAKQGWKLLWDGQTSHGWRSAKSQNFPEKGWEIHDGVLSVTASGGAEGGESGEDIVTLEKYSDFELVADFKIYAGTNSGIKYFVDTDLNKGPGSAIGLEFQILDDERNREAKLGRNGNRTMGSLYDLIPAAANKIVKPIGEWNTARIVARGAHVEHWLNGMRVLAYTRFTPKFRQLVAESKYKVWPHFGELKEGPILLQNHGDAVGFRNIKIRRLTPSM